jgi:flagellar motor switch protein FliG
VNNLGAVHSFESSEETLEILPHLTDSEVSEILSEVAMLEVWQNGNYLILVAECRDKRADGVRVLQVVEQF